MVTLSGSVIRGAAVTGDCGVIAFASSAAAVLTSLNVDPGGYVALIALLISGESALFGSSEFQAFFCVGPSWLASGFGSYDGVETIARISPVCGRIATTLPLYPLEVIAS